MNLPEFNINSPRHLSLLFFGGHLKIKVKEELIGNDGQPIKFKNKDEIKTKLIDKDTFVKGLGLEPLKEWKTKKENIYSVNEKTLLYIRDQL